MILVYVLLKFFQHLGNKVNFLENYSASGKSLDATPIFVSVTQPKLISTHYTQTLR